MLGRRALHFVFKIGNRPASIDFYTNVLGMTVLRHEEFEGGCDAACNGPYDGAWSKTMIGYGPEDDHFVLELTYNYGISSYKKGNEFQGLTVKSSDIMSRVRKAGYPFTEGEKYNTVVSPCGYTFNIEESKDTTIAQITEFILSSSNLKTSEKYWGELLSMKNYSTTKDARISYGYEDKQAKLVLRQIPDAIDRGSAFGRVAFSCPSEQLKGIQEQMEKNKETVLTPYISLDTPGKATVQVVILADPDGHEICFVGDEGFRELSKVDPNATKLLDEAIKSDKSVEWFKNHGKGKKEI